MDIDILLVLQEFRNGAGAFLADFLSKMTFLGELNTVIVVMAVIYWAISKEFGAYLLMGSKIPDQPDPAVSLPDP